MVGQIQRAMMLAAFGVAARLTPGSFTHARAADVLRVGTPEDSVEAIVQSFLDLGVLQKRPADLKKLYTGEFLP